MADRQESPGVDEDLEGWEYLKSIVFDDNELAAEDGIVLGPVLREADGKELAGMLDALVRNFRKVWLEYGKVTEAAAQSNEFYQSDRYELLPEALQLLHVWFRAFNSLRDAESWLYREFGPSKDKEVLDEIADALVALYWGIDSMRSIPLDWDYLADEDETLRDSLDDLHRLARKVEERPVTGAKKGETDAEAGEGVQTEESRAGKEGGASLGPVVRSFRFLRRWLTRRILEAYEFRYSLPSVLGELAERKEEREETEPKASGMRFAWIAGRTPQGTQAQIDRELADILASARTSLEGGCKPIVEGIGIEAHAGRSAVGLVLHKGRILWADLQHRAPFWTLRPGEGERLGNVIDALVRWLSSVTPPPMDGHSADEVQDKLLQALQVLRINPYSHNFEFAMAVAGEMEDAQARLDKAERLLGRWALSAGDRGEARERQAVFRLHNPAGTGPADPKAPKTLSNRGYAWPLVTPPEHDAPAQTDEDRRERLVWLCKDMLVRLEENAAGFVHLPKHLGEAGRLAVSLGFLSPPVQVTMWTPNWSSVEPKVGCDWPSPAEWDGCSKGEVGVEFALGYRVHDPQGGVPDDVIVQASAAKERESNRCVNLVGRNAVAEAANMIVSALRLWLSSLEALPSQPGRRGSTDQQQPDGTPGKALKEPSRLAMQCYCLHIAREITQTEIAAMLSKEHKRSITQGQVSKWIKKVREYLEARNVRPDLDTTAAKGNLHYVDPAKLDYQDKPDGRTRPPKSPHQYDGDD